MTDHRAQVEQLLADYRRSREKLAQTQRDLAAITETARSDDGSVQVVVGAQGTLRDLMFRDDVYQRMCPAQLAATILRLSATAGTAAAARVAEVLTPILPEGADPAAIIAGRAELESQRSQGTRGGQDPAGEPVFDNGGWLADNAARRT